MGCVDDLPLEGEPWSARNSERNLQDEDAVADAEVAIEAGKDESVDE